MRGCLDVKLIRLIQIKENPVPLTHYSIQESPFPPGFLIYKTGLKTLI